MSILILSQRLDYHGRAIAWGLKSKGADVHWWDRSVFPASQAISLCIPPEYSTNLRVDNSEVTQEPQSYTAIWERRGKVPTASSSLTNADKRVAVSESRKLLNGIVSLLELANPRALLVNPSTIQERANEKALQLHVARRVGFCIPDTLCSNHPSDIKQFYLRHRGNIVAKQHFPFSWRQDNGDLLLSGTYVVTPDAMEYPAMLSSSPMIFQEALDIRDELRIIVFGRTVFAGAQPRSSMATPGFLDIKLEARDEIQAVEIPVQLRERCFAYMEAMGLNYAAFDVARCKDGRELFLEANESGQFLMLERLNELCPIFDAFCAFLMSGDDRFDYKYRAATALRLADYDESADGQLFKIEFDRFFKDEYTGTPFELTDS